MKHWQTMSRRHLLGAMAMAIAIAGAASAASATAAGAQKPAPVANLSALMAGGATGVAGAVDAAGGGERITGAGLPRGQTYLLYSVDLSGVAQGVAFRTQGHLVVTGTIDRTATRNGVNPLDILLITGEPYRPTASPGTISYATNSGFDELRDGPNAAAQLDGAFVSFNPATSVLDVRPDPGVAAALSRNNFTGRGGLFGDMYLIKDGRMLIQFSSDARSITGAADLVGTGYLYRSNTPYRAQLAGRLLQQGQFQ